MMLLLVGVIAGNRRHQAQRKFLCSSPAGGGRKYAGQTSFMPLRVNFAGSCRDLRPGILMFPQTYFQTLGTRFELKFLRDILIGSPKVRLFT